MFCMWCSAVLDEMNNWVAISPAVRPSATRRSTSISRRLRPPGRARRVRRLGLAVGRVQASRVAREETFEKVDAMLTDEGDALVPGRERAAHIALGERHPCDPERVGDPIGVAERSRGGDGFLSELECLLD